jgi:hypothetical protein
MIATADTRFSTSCIVNVMPKSNLFCEPALDFNINKAAVKLKERNSNIACETSNMLVLQGFEEPVQQVAYQFDENQKLITSVVKLSSSVFSELLDFMNERYDQWPTSERSNNMLIWRGNDMEIVSIMMDNAYYVVYNPLSDKSTTSNAVHTVETIRKNSK